MKKMSLGEGEASLLAPPMPSALLEELQEELGHDHTIYDTVENRVTLAHHQVWWQSPEGPYELMVSLDRMGRFFIRRVYMAHSRAGHLTNIFEIIKRYRDVCKIKSIVIESVLTLEMQAWCIKHHFRRPACGTTMDNGLICGDWYYDFEAE